MIEINLIPERLKKQRKMILVYFGAGIAVAAVLGVLAFIVMTQNKEIARIDREIRRIDAESASLKDKIDEVKKFRELEDVFNRKKAILDRLSVEQAVWPRILDALGEYTLPDMWLHSVEQERERDDGVALRVVGYSLSKVIVADFIKRLEQSTQVSELKAARIAEAIDQVSGMKVVQFEISFVFKK